MDCSDVDYVDSIFDLSLFANTPLALEAALSDGSEFWCTSEIAGLQFYSYNSDDDLIGKVIPKVGDSITIMRRPNNPKDRNACEVWWRNNFLLGHLPRGLASQIAHEIDEGKGLRAYVINDGDGSPWSLELLLVGRAVEESHRHRIQWQRKVHASQEQFMIDDFVSNYNSTYEFPTHEQKEDNDTFEFLYNHRRQKRLANARYVFFDLPDEIEAEKLQAENKQKYEAWYAAQVDKLLAGAVVDFGRRWPREYLMTKTEIKKQFRFDPAKVLTHAAYTKDTRYKKLEYYKLYKKADVIEYVANSQKPAKTQRSTKKPALPVITIANCDPDCTDMNIPW